MKFGKVYERLRSNPIFQKYLPDAPFFPYKHVKTLIKNMIKIEDEGLKSAENQKILSEFNVFIQLTCDFVDGHVEKHKSVDESHIKYIKEYKALKEYCKVVKEAIRKGAKKYDKLAYPKNAFYQKQLIQRMDQRELGNQEQIDILLQKAKDEEQELLENENFGLLLQDVHQLHNNQSQVINMLDTGDKKQTFYFEMVQGFLALVAIPIALTPYLDTGLTILGNIFTLTMPLAFFLGAAIGGSYGNKTLSKKQAFYLGALFEAQVFGALTLGGFAKSSKKVKEISLENINVHEFRGYTEDLNFVTLGIPSLMTFLGYKLIAASIYGQPINVQKYTTIAIVGVAVYLVKNTEGFVTNTFAQFINSLMSPPLIAFFLTTGIYFFILIFIKNAQNPYKRAIQCLPVFGFLKISGLVFLILQYGLDLEPFYVILFISLIAGSVAYIFFFLYGQSQLAKTQNEQAEVIKKKDLEEMAIGIFKPLLLVSALVAAFMNGSEDVGKFIKPLVAALNLEKPSNTLEENFVYWSLVIFTASLCSGVLGLFSRTIKTKMTTLNPMESFAVQVGASSAIVLSLFEKLPITPSFCTVGAVVGAVFAENIFNWKKFKKIKYVKKLLMKLVFITPYFVLISLYMYYFTHIQIKTSQNFQNQNQFKNEL